MSLNLQICFAVATKPTQDYTVVIAVIVSVCTIILLAVLILILCCRKKLASKQMGFAFLLKILFKALLEVIKPMKHVKVMLDLAMFTSNPLI